MKLPIRLFSMMAFFFVLSFNVSAQRGDKAMSVEKRAERQSNEMIESLQLSEAQGDQVKAINMKYAEKMATMKAESKDLSEADRKNMRAEMKPLREQQETELMAVFTPEQAEKYATMKSERPGKKSKQGKKMKKEGAIMKGEKTMEKQGN